MSDTVITLTLPEKVYQQVKQIAEASGQPLETVILEMVDQPLDTASLEHYTDAQLWGMVYRRLPQHVDDRWRELLDVRQDRALTDSENAELERFVAMNDVYVLHRSKALLLLKQRGQDVDAYLRID